MRPERSFRFQFEVQVWGKILLLPDLLKEILADVAQEYWISLFIQKILSKKWNEFKCGVWNLKPSKAKDVVIFECIEWTLNLLKV